MKTLLTATGILIIIGIAAFLFFRIYFINDTIVEGSGYGFSIGMTKAEVFQKVVNKYKNNTIYMLHPINHDEWGPHYKLTFSKGDLSILLERNVWRLYFDESYSNGIVFKFSNEKLVEIWRYRGSFELP